MEKLRHLLESGGDEDTSGPWGQGYNLLHEMKRIIPELPEEASQVMQFIVPDMDTGAELFAGRGDIHAIQETLSESMTTVEELCRDIGEGNGSMDRLGALGSELKKIFEECGACTTKQSNNGGGKPSKEELLKALHEEIEVLQTIGAASLSMLEPLSFQDLVGQRIQRIIRLVESMETRIEDLIISFGIKLKKHKEFPSKTCKELERDVKKFKSELKGPQSKGEGLEQEDIDALLAAL
jgi:hypothetical protein